ncbi:MAG: Na(+)-translocating NADH-quinone reductase subunit A [Thermoanaerobaculia bacterium]|nr:Na(+)-translocating NADH-quinone reductase subunit A [Thermoanaerobaculia bacterium]
MAVHKIRKGLDLPILGSPEQVIEDARQPERVAVVALDYHGMKPTMHVQEGDAVRRGQLLFVDKKTEGVRYTAPGSGKVVSVHRGAKRALQTVVIELDESERSGDASAADTIRFASDTGKHPSELSRQEVEDLLVESGLWTALRTRPFDKVARPGTEPNSIFVTAVDSHPLAPDPAVVLRGRGDDFERGIAALARLTEGPVFVCTAEGIQVQVPRDGKVRVEQFAGPHPSGTPGFHIHTLDPVDRKKLVWHVGYQDVLAIGKLFHGGALDVERVVALAGPPVGRPRLLRTRVGAELAPLLRGEIADGAKVRVISGSVLDGRRAEGDVLGFLGRYDRHISILEEGDERELVGWMLPGTNKFSTLKTFASALLPGKKFNMTTSTGGSHRAIVAVEDMYERVFPFDMEPTYVLKALAVHDVEYAEALGVLELAEEDMALCTFVCASKNDYGVLIRDVLTTIEKEG